MSMGGGAYSNDGRVTSQSQDNLDVMGKLTPQRLRRLRL